VKAAEAPDPARGEERLGPRWPAWTGMALCVVGFGIAAYLTYEHYTGSRSLSCPATGGIVNCLAVTTSKYSQIHLPIGHLHVPVAPLGLVFFAVMFVFQTPRAWASQILAVRVGRVVWSLVGVGTAVWLIYAELFRIHNICLWCTSVHVISLLLFILTVFGTAVTSPDYGGWDEQEDRVEEDQGEDHGEVAEAPPVQEDVGTV
jgi:uncharacterized membrane protein